MYQLATGTLSKIFESEDRVVAFDVDRETLSLASAGLHKATIFSLVKASASSDLQEKSEACVYETSACIDSIVFVRLGQCLHVVIGTHCSFHIVATQQGLLTLINLQETSRVEINTKLPQGDAIACICSVPISGVGELFG